ncbi:sodium-coupled monocarboxylate transporter 1 [Rhinophrynus dorsalis]
MAIPGDIGSFTVWDYVVFSMMLLISAAIGIYYAFAGGGQKTSKDFLMGGRSMTAVPVALSLTASFMSAVTVLGTPAEVYRYGAMFSIFAITYTLVVIFCSEVFLPVFYRLGITSTYEYLELRFNKCVRLLGTGLFIIQTILYTGIVIYAPALALNQVTGFDLWGAVIATGVVCTFYCTLGGLKAVVWTDVFQVGIMIAGFVSVIIRAIIIKGGIGPILNDAYHGDRLNFWDFNPHPLQRHSFWTIVIGGTFNWSGMYGVNQSQVQRYLACKTKFQAKMSLYVNLLGLWAILCCAVLSGLAMYSIYKECDPWTAKFVSAPDQLMPYMVLDILRDFPGLPGLFVACAYSGTLSTVSSSINALAAVTVEDLIKPYCKPLNETKLSWISKGTSLLYGAVCIAMAALASVMGGLLQAALSIFGIIGGPLLGLFSLGIIIPFANSTGATIGLLSGFTVSLWVGVGAQIYPPLPIRSLPKILSTAGCNLSSVENNWNSTTELPILTTLITEAQGSNRPALADNWYSLSYLYFSATGTIIVFLVGLIISLLTGGSKQKVNRDFLLTSKDYPHFKRLFSCCKKDKEAALSYHSVRKPILRLEWRLNKKPNFLQFTQSFTARVISRLWEKNMGSSSGIGFFTPWDYAIFAAVLLISAGIGVYYAFAGRGKDTSQEFLTGGRSMTALPVALSLTASFMSAVTILGTPADVYRFGAMYSIFAISYVLVVIICAEIFLPVFYRLKITSTYEYLELRFNKCVRILGTIIFIIEMILYTGIVIYAPALALNQVSGFNLWGAMTATGLVCTFYCALGGLKAVIWTDAFQIVIMLAGFIAVIIRGVIVQGGIQRIMNDSYYGGRLNFWDFDPHPLRRHTFWTIVIGGTFLWTGIYGVNQSQVQRYIACKSKFQAKLSLYINLIGLLAILACAVLSGLILYSVYKDCDPWTSKIISAPDQLMPYLVLDILRDYPGVPGLFVACAYSGTLSTVSSSINALAAVTVEDLIKPYTNLSETKLSWTSKGMSAFYGIVCIAMAAVASFMGSVIQAALSIFAMVGGPLLGLFSLGMFFPFCNSLGAIVGLLFGFSMSLWAGVGAQIYPPLPERSRPLPLSTAGCNFSTMDTIWSFNTTEETMTMLPTLMQPDISERSALADNWYSLSYLYFSTLGTLVTVIVGVIVSLLSGGLKQNINPEFVYGKQDFSLDIFSCGKSHKVDKVKVMNWKPHPDHGLDNPSFKPDDLDPAELK